MRLSIRIFLCVILSQGFLLGSSEYNAQCGSVVLTHCGLESFLIQDLADQDIAKFPAVGPVENDSWFLSYEDEQPLIDTLSTSFASLLYNNSLDVHAIHNDFKQQELYENNEPKNESDLSGSRKRREIERFDKQIFPSSSRKKSKHCSIAPTISLKKQSEKERAAVMRKNQRDSARIVKEGRLSEYSSEDQKIIEIRAARYARKRELDRQYANRNK